MNMLNKLQPDLFYKGLDEEGKPMGILDNWVAKHNGAVSPSSLSKLEKTRIESRQSIFKEFKEDSSIKESVQRHTCLNVLMARVGNKSVVLFDTVFRPEDLDVVTRGNTSLYYDKTINEAMGVIHVWDE